MDQKHLKSNRHQPQGDLSEGFGWRLVASDWWLVAGFEGHGLGIAGIAGFVAAAESLGLERSHLYRKMKALGINVKE